MGVQGPDMSPSARRKTNLRGVAAVAFVAVGASAVALLQASKGNVARAGIAGATAQTQKIVFNRDIRPILSDRCFACHGPDPNKRQAGLRLDRPEAALGALPQHPKLKAFVPGHPEESEALKRILATDATVMPPVSFHRALDEKEKELVRQWVIQGGDYQEHWAFVKPERPALPAVKDSAWPKGEIDRFVLANLEERGLHPSKQADKATLIRRASVDLTGIPPTAAEVDAFVADGSPNAYEKVVDRLLASPRYGEQMAVQWLDYARYADSHGYQSDPQRFMSLWRDWVIDAYNADMPFDEFTVEQLAGDMIPNATASQRIASGFNRNHRINNEGGIIAEEWRIEGVVDRVSSTSAVFLGLTMECCRCHDHKYDPITQRDFYAFSGFFNSVNESGMGELGPTDRGANVPPILKVPTAEQQKQLAELDGKKEELRKRIEALRAGIPDRVAKMSKADPTLAEPGGLAVKFTSDGKIGAGDASGAPVDVELAGNATPTFAESKGGKAITFDGKTNLVVKDEGAANFERSDAFSYGAWINRRGGSSFMSRMNIRDNYRGFDVFVDAGSRVNVHLVNRWDGNAIRVLTRAQVRNGQWTHVMATYDGSGRASGVRIYLDGKPASLEVTHDALTETIRTPSHFRLGGRDGGDAFVGDVRDARVYSRALNPTEVATVAHGESVRAILDVAAEKRTKEQNAELASYAAATSPELVDAGERLAKVSGERERLYGMVPDTMVMEELPKPRDTYVLIRGEYDKHGEKVEPGTPAVLPPMPKGAPPNRLGLAKWIVDPNNPLTPRVQANRLWEKFFGVGLVKTSENLGVQTEWPSNPELLDFLATEMLRLKWDLKAFQKELAMSAAYQQASEVAPELQEMDPENRLLARGPRFRMTAEQVRDQALAASGLLVEKVGGPSVKPYAPDDLWAGNLYGNLSKYVVDSGEGLYRRSLYTFIKRTANPANLSIFDQPSREYCVIRRSRTNTPLQALDLMNDPQYLEAARALAERAMADEKGPDKRVGEMFKRVIGREANARELKVLTDGLAKHLERFKGDPAGARALIAVGQSKPNAQLDPAELAAYGLTASVILNLDEAVTVP